MHRTLRQRKELVRPSVVAPLYLCKNRIDFMALYKLCRSLAIGASPYPVLNVAVFSVSFFLAAHHVVSLWGSEKRAERLTGRLTKPNKDNVLSTPSRSCVPSDCVCSLVEHGRRRQPRHGSGGGPARRRRSARCPSGR